MWHDLLAAGLTCGLHAIERRQVAVDDKVDADAGRPQGALCLRRIPADVMAGALRRHDLHRKEVLLSDVLGLSMLTVAINAPSEPGCTESTVFGPFHVEGAPEVQQLVGTLSRDELGVFVTSGILGTPNNLAVRDVLNDKRGVCQDFAHVMIVLCRPLGIRLVEIKIRAPG